MILHNYNRGGRVGICNFHHVSRFTVTFTAHFMITTNAHLFFSRFAYEQLHLPYSTTSLGVVPSCFGRGQDLSNPM